MKKPHIPVLMVITFAFLTFTIGIFIGRNYTGRPVALSFPESMQLPPPETVVVQDPAFKTDNTVDFPLDINTATLENLMALPGIGEGLAGQIIVYREEHGSFSHVEELMNVPGIGEKRLESLLSFIRIGGTP